MVNKRETTGGVHNGFDSDHSDPSRDRKIKPMNSPARHALYTIVTTIAIGIIAIVMVFVLTQTRILAKDNQRLSQDIKHQTDINQNYLRCIILLPKEAYADIDTRIKALDKCAEDSRKTL